MKQFKIIEDNAFILSYKSVKEEIMAPERPKKCVNQINIAKEKYDKQKLLMEESEKNFTNKVFNTYSEPKFRNSLIKDLIDSYYTPEKIERIKKAFDNYSVDLIDINMANEIVEAERHVSEHKKEGFFSRIANMFYSEDEDESQTQI